MPPSDSMNEPVSEQAAPDMPPINVAIAKEMLKEAKQIMDALGVVFFLRQGTCLGPIRDNDLIPWDDDVDLGSVIGLHGLTEKTIDIVAAAFEENGYVLNVGRTDHNIYVEMTKQSNKMDWNCYWIFDDHIFHYPGVRIPLHLFTDLKEIDFIGEKFLVPNPPEEYLSIKYGSNWMTPKKRAWMTDVVQMIPETSVSGRSGKLKQLLTTTILPWRAVKLRVLDDAGIPVSGAEILIAGYNQSKTNKQGYAKFYVPRNDWYAMVVKYDQHEELLYEEWMAPGGTYIYRPDSSVPPGRLNVLTRQ